MQQRDDVGVREPRGELHFTTEAFTVHARRQLWWEHLDDDLTPERMLLGDEHPAHAAAGQFALDRVARTEGGLEIFEMLVGHRTQYTIWWQPR